MQTLLPNSIEQKLKDLAFQSYPEEACALICENELVLPLKNISEEPKTSFKLDEIELLYLLIALQGKSCSIWHSHTQKHPLFDIRTPSAEDINLHYSSGCPVLISGIDKGRYFSTVRFPNPHNSSQAILGRPYIAGIFDCGTLIRDVYKKFYEVELLYEFKSSYLYPKNWAKAVQSFLKTNEFVRLSNSEPLKEGDLLVVDRQGFAASHGGMVWNDEGVILDQRDMSCLVSMEDFSRIDSKWRLL